MTKSFIKFINTLIGKEKILKYKSFYNDIFTWNISSNTNI